jgi:hypothetical protein
MAVSSLSRFLVATYTCPMFAQRLPAYSPDKNPIEIVEEHQTEGDAAVTCQFLMPVATNLSIIFLTNDGDCVNLGVFLIGIENRNRMCECHTWTYISKS